MLEGQQRLEGQQLGRLEGQQLEVEGQQLQEVGGAAAVGGWRGSSCGRLEGQQLQEVGGAAAVGECVGLPCTVVVPKGAPKVKCDAILSYGAELVLCDPTPASRKDTCARVAEETGKTIIHSSDNYNVIAGQGTIAMELLDEVPDLDAILIPTSGGGMLAGVSLAARSMQPKCQVYAVEPVGKNLQRCLEAKQMLWPDSPSFLNTVADSIRLQAIGHLAFPIICDNANSRVFTVTDDQMIEGMKLSFERLKQVVEAASGAGVYAALNLINDVQPMARKVGVILCGGNVDLENLPWIAATTSY
ncbi:serine racemase-like [Homarus americanus]|nr:serine racemase-like [Homarus americanus]